MREIKFFCGAYYFYKDEEELASISSSQGGIGLEDAMECARVLWETGNRVSETFTEIPPRLWKDFDDLLKFAQEGLTLVEGRSA
jgi:hypothetical protein